MLNILFNVLSAIFNLLTLLLFIPFLRLLFRPDQDLEVLTQAPIMDQSEGWLSGFKTWSAQYLDYLMSSFILESGKEGALLFICISIIILFFLKNITRYLALYFLAVVRIGVVRDIRQQMYGKLLSLPVGYYTDERKGDLMTRMTSDVSEVEWSVLSTLELIFREPFTILIFLFSMVVISPYLTMISILLIPISALVIGRVSKSLKRTSEKGQAKLGQLISTLEEMLSGLRILKAFTAEDFNKRKFDEQNNDYRKLMIRLYRKRDLASPLSEFLGALVLTALVWTGGQLVFGEGAEGFSGEQFIGFVIVFSQLMRPVQGVASAISSIHKGLASLDRIDVVLKAHDQIKEKPDAQTLAPLEKGIRYNIRSFSYGSQEVLKDIQFDVPKGKTVALVGPSGSGKSTLADLLPRFYDLQDGKVEVDGHDIRDLTLKSLRQQMGIVSQESVLFNDTVLANITLGDDKPDEARAREAARIANAHEFIKRLDNGYQTSIGERGSKLSGGQRQRLSIARAIYKNPPILILDEATSALDTESEKLVQDALNELMKNRTTLVIAHRLSTVRHADEIIVLSEGRIVERGTHDQLVALNGLYHKLCTMQALA